ncbi:hypothetical protein Bca4012_043917 [Brassica carinata]|uniref:Uncharacterized protein n=2 Tax=Brassica TaxID=3705 RepID=A0ABQ7XS30_BRANA|nr:hypothetical protein HID58_087004 [Brassica napus]
MAEDRIVPYEHPTSSMAGQGNDDSNGSQWIGVDDLKPAGTSEPEISETSISPSDEFLKAKRLASTIVTPSRVTSAQGDNVTIRAKCTPRSLTFSPSSLQVEANGFENEQIIGALNDMELVDRNNDGSMMECEAQEDDLLGEDLIAMEDVHTYTLATSSTT